MTRKDTRNWVTWGVTCALAVGGLVGILYVQPLLYLRWSFDRHCAEINEAREVHDQAIKCEEFAKWIVRNRIAPVRISGVDTSLDCSSRGNEQRSYQCEVTAYFLMAPRCMSVKSHTLTLLSGENHEILFRAVRLMEW